MTVYIYGRVSHRDSGSSGLSEASQLLAGKTYIESVLPHEPLGQTSFPVGNAPGYYFDRAASAWKAPFTNREGACALTEVLKPGDHIVFYNVERGFRSTLAFCQQMEYWEKHGIHAHFITEGMNFSSPEGKLLLRTMAAYAEYYSDLVSARTKEALAIKRLGKLKKPNEPRANWAATDFKFITEKPKAIESKPAGRIFTYARCSHIDSELSGLGMGAQLTGVVRYADRLAAFNPNLVRHKEHFEDNSVSAFHVPFNQRPSGKRLMEMVQAGDVIVVYRTDRMFRHPLDVARIVEELNKRGVAIHIVQGGIDTSTQAGQMFIHMLTMFAHLESAIKSRRAKDIKEHLRSQGRPDGPTPRYAKVLIDQKTMQKKLVYNYEKIVMFGCCYTMRDILGMQVPHISDVMHAIACSHDFRKPVPRGMRKSNWGEVYVKEAINIFRGLKNTLPPEAIADALRTGITILEQDVNTFFKAFLKTSFPLRDLESQIADHLSVDETIRLPRPS